MLGDKQEKDWAKPGMLIDAVKLSPAAKANVRGKSGVSARASTPNPDTEN